MGSPFLIQGVQGFGDWAKGNLCRCLTKKMLSYATGRQTNSGDRLVVDGIVDEMKVIKGLRDLVKKIVLSETFRGN